MCGQLRASDVSKTVRLSGWLQYQRMAGMFIVLRDALGTVQVVMPDQQVRELNMSCGDIELTCSKV